MKKLFYILPLLLFFSLAVPAQNSSNTEQMEGPKRPIIDDIGTSKAVANDKKLLDPIPAVEENENDSGASNGTGSNDDGTQSAKSIKPDNDSEQTTDAEEVRENLKIYPNPAINNLKIELGKEVNVSISLLNVIGQEVYTTEGQFKELEIEVSQFPQGTYFISISIDNERIIKRIEISN